MPAVEVGRPKRKTQLLPEVRQAQGAKLLGRASSLGKLVGEFEGRVRLPISWPAVVVAPK